MHKEKLERLLKITSAHQSETGLSDNLRRRLAEVATYVLLNVWWKSDELTPTRALQDLADAVQAKLDRGLTSRVLQSDNDISEVKDLIGKIMSLIDVLQVSQIGGDVLNSPSVQFEGGILVEIGVERIKTGVEQIQDGVGQVQDGINEVARSVDDINKVRIPSSLQAPN